MLGSISYVVNVVWHGLYRGHGCQERAILHAYAEKPHFVVVAQPIHLFPEV